MDIDAKEKEIMDALNMLRRETQPGPQSNEYAIHYFFSVIRNGVQDIAKEARAEAEAREYLQERMGVE